MGKVRAGVALGLRFHSRAHCVRHHGAAGAERLFPANADGDPVYINGREFRHKLAPGEDSSRVAKRMTGEIFRLVNGEMSGRRRLVFPNMGVA
jgi:hypothetical protein